MRIPKFANIARRTGQQIGWFLKEAIPHFMLGALLLFLLDQAGGLSWLRDQFEPVSVTLLGLPVQSADVFLLTMVRREAGAALLAQQALAGAYAGDQVVVTLLVMTLMVPCINSVLVLYKERGLKTASGMLMLVMGIAFLVGGLVHAMIDWTGLVL